jgi:hypothetical protein
MIFRQPVPHIRRKQKHLITPHRTITPSHTRFSQGRRHRPGWDTPFCDRLYDVEIRRVICSTNAIESLNARYRRAVRARGHFPTEQAALKCLYLATRALDPTGKGRARWATRWKPALNAFAISSTKNQLNANRGSTEKRTVPAGVVPQRGAVPGVGSGDLPPILRGSELVSQRPVRGGDVGEGRVRSQPKRVRPLLWRFGLVYLTQVTLLLQRPGMKPRAVCVGLCCP